MRHCVRVSDSAETFEIIIDSKGQFDNRIQYSPGMFSETARQKTVQDLSSDTPAQVRIEVLT